MFCEVERSYIEDGFNLYGLRACVSNFSDCLDLILDRIGPDDSDDSHLTQSACTLYGLIHARYIITAHGLDAMYNKVTNDIISFVFVMGYEVFLEALYCVGVPALLPDRSDHELHFPLLLCQFALLTISTLRKISGHVRWFSAVVNPYCRLG